MIRWMRQISDEPVDDPEDTADNEGTLEEPGKVLYEDNCMGCHGADATGVSAPGTRGPTR